MTKLGVGGTTPRPETLQTLKFQRLVLLLIQKFLPCLLLMFPGAPGSGSLAFPGLRYSYLTRVFPVGFFCTEPLDPDTPISARSSPGLTFICGFLWLCASQKTPLLLVKTTSQGTNVQRSWVRQNKKLMQTSDWHPKDFLHLNKGSEN